MTLWDTTVSPPTEQRRLQASTESIRGIDFSPDGTLIAAGGDDGSARIWTVLDGELWTVLDGHLSFRVSGRSAPLSISDVRFTPDSRGIATCGTDGTVRVWELDRDRGTILSGPDRGGFGAQVVDDETLIAGRLSSARLLDRRTGSVLEKFPSGASGIIHVSASPDGRYVVAGNSRAVTLRDRAQGEDLHRFVSRTAPNNFNPGSSFDPAGRYFAVSLGRSVFVWSFEAATSAAVSRPVPVWGLAFAPSGDLYVGTVEGRIAVLEVGDWRERRSWDASEKPLTRLAVNPDGTRLASSGHDSTIRLWSTETNELIHEIVVSEGLRFQDVAFHPGGQTLASATTGPRGDSALGRCDRNRAALLRSPGRDDLRGGLHPGRTLRRRRDDGRGDRRLSGRRVEGPRRVGSRSRAVRNPRSAGAAAASRESLRSPRNTTRPQAAAHPPGDSLALVVCGAEREACRPRGALRPLRIHRERAGCVGRSSRADRRRSPCVRGTTDRRSPSTSAARERARTIGARAPDDRFSRLVRARALQDGTDPRADPARSGSPRRRDRGPRARRRRGAASGSLGRPTFHRSGTTRDGGYRPASRAREGIGWPSW